MKKIISIVSAVILLSAFAVCFASCGKTDSLPADKETVSVRESAMSAEDIALLEEVFQKETAYLASLQLENGAIPMTYSANGTLTMNPYFADFAALALLDNPGEYADEVKAYMDWHFAHLNDKKDDYNGVDGTIYDYKITVADGKVTEETVAETDGVKHYDSTDSYAATFLMVLKKYYKNTGDKEYIIAHGKDIERIATAMLSTMHKGLTFAKPDYEVKYLMDNSEVYDGLQCTTDLFETLVATGDSSYETVLKKCKKASEKLTEAFESDLWDADANHYKSGIFRNGEAISDFSWDEYYPDATSQLFPIIHGVINADTQRANQLYDKFCESFDWQNLDIPSEFCWGSNVLAAAKMSDAERVVSYMTAFSEKYQSHEYPLYNADSARVSMAAYILLEGNN